MGAAVKKPQEIERPKAYPIDYDYYHFPVEFEHKWRLTYGRLAPCILELIWRNTGAKKRKPGTPPPEWVCLTLQDFAEALNFQRPGTAEFKREQKALLSSAQTAVQDLTDRKVISCLTAAKAREAGLKSPNSQSRWYKCNWKDWPKLATPDVSPFVKPEKPAAEEAEEQKVVPIRAEHRQRVIAGKPVAWTFDNPEPVSRVEIVSREKNATVEAEVQQRSGGVIRVELPRVEVTENITDRLTVDRQTKSKDPAVEPIPAAPAATRGNARPVQTDTPAAAAGNGDGRRQSVTAKALMELMQKFGNSISPTEARELAAILGPADPARLLERIEKRVRRMHARRPPEYLEFTVLRLMAEDERQKWPQELARRRGAERPAQQHQESSITPERVAELRAQLADPATPEEDRPLIRSILGAHA